VRRKRRVGERLERRQWFFQQENQQVHRTGQK
jgi:hypothetical protein